MTRIAIFHENFAQNGGAERVAESMAQLLPEADVLSTVTVSERLSAYMKDRGVLNTWMQYLPGLKRFYRHYFAIYPLAIASAPVRSYGLILSSCFGFAKGLRKGRNAVHVCYCHTPPRWLWRTNDYLQREHFSPLARFAVLTFNRMVRSLDLRFSESPDVFIANSSAVAERIYRIYGREAHVLYPPVEVDRFRIAGEPQNFYLVVSRLVAYKRIDLAIEACNRLGVPLKVIGEGPHLKRLQAMAGPTIEFLGRRSDQEVADHLSRCKALIFPGEEDFGITPLEATASGRPVLAFGAGGALDTVIDGVTGVFFPQPTAESLARAILQLNDLSFDAVVLRRHAESFSTEVFQRRLLALLQAIVEKEDRRDVLEELNRANVTWESSIAA